MLNFILSLAFNLPFAIVVFVPIFLLTRKKIEQQYHWGILLIMWFVMAFVNPSTSPTPNSGHQTTTPQPTTASVPAINQGMSNAPTSSSANACNEVEKNIKKAKFEIDKYYDINKVSPPSLENTEFKATYGVKVSYLKFGYESKYLGPSIFLKATHPSCSQQYTIGPDDSTIKIAQKVAE